METAKELTFGIELELAVTSRKRFFRTSGSHTYGRPVAQTHLRELGEKPFVSMRDGSIRAQNAYVFELVSPILWGQYGLERIFAQMEEWNLSDGHYFVNSTMGYHLHIGAEHLTMQQRKRVINAYQYYEHTFFGLNGDHVRERYQNRFCKPLETHSSSLENSRYLALNTRNLVPGGKGTIEFRMWRSTTDAEIVATSIYMATALVIYAKDNPFFDEVHSPRSCLEGALDFIDILDEPNCRIIEKENADDVATVLLAQCEKAHEVFFANRERVPA